jgi:hypothetical protein
MFIHRLWDKAVGTPDYNKEEWKQLEAELLGYKSQAERYKKILERLVLSHDQGIESVFIIVEDAREVLK